MDRTIVSGCDNTMHSCQSHQSGRTPNLSLQLQPPSDLLICLHAYMLTANEQSSYAWGFSTSAYRQQEQLTPKDTMTALNHC